MRDTPSISAGTTAAASAPGQALGNAHGHVHGHAHGHAHGHDHTHDHAHGHAHDPGLIHAPGLSLLRLSVAARLAGAAALSALLWAGVLWALA